MRAWRQGAERPGHLELSNPENVAHTPQVAALGFCSVFDQLMEGFPQPEAKDQIFTCVPPRCRAWRRGRGGQSLTGAWWRPVKGTVAPPRSPL